MQQIDAYLCRIRLADKTVGVIINTKGDSFETIELPWLDNKPRVSCIPDGTKTDHVKGCIGIGTAAQEKEFMLSMPVKGKIQIKTLNA